MSKILVLDAGHDEADPGAVGNGLKEADLTIKICENVKVRLAPYDVQVLICPRSDSLSDRAQYAADKKADYFLSIHVNAAADPTANGFESFCCIGALEESERIRRVLHDEIVAFLSTQGIRDRGKKNHSWTVLYRSHIADIPAALLECLFINNPLEARKLASDTFISGLANSIAYGLVLALRLQKKALITPAPIPVTVVNPTAAAITKLYSAGKIKSADYWNINAKAGETCRGDYVAALLQAWAEDLSE